MHSVRVIEDPHIMYSKLCQFVSLHKEMTLVFLTFIIMYFEIHHTEHYLYLIRVTTCHTGNLFIDIL